MARLLNSAHDHLFRTLGKVLRLGSRPESVRFARPLFHKELMLQKQIPSVQSFSAFHFFSRVALTLLLVSDRLRN
jgi:hypothetical protein